MGARLVSPNHNHVRTYASRLLVALPVGAAGVLFLMSTGCNKLDPRAIFAGHTKTDPNVNNILDKARMEGALISYARDHDGHFPGGRATPEASLCLLYPEYADVDLLRDDMHISLGKAKRLLDNGEPLIGDACRWHYVPDLTLNDNPQTALAWLKNTELTGVAGEPTVVCVDSPFALSPGSSVEKCQAFWKYQETLLANRDQLSKEGGCVLSMFIRLPSGRTVNRYPESYQFTYHYEPEPGGRGDGFEAGNTLSSDMLNWFRSHQFLNEGTYTLTITLSLPGMTSKPVKVNVQNKVVTPKAIVFEMRHQG